MRDWTAVEDRGQVGETKDREQIAQPGACLCHLQLIGSKVDDVAIEVYRNPHESNEPDPEFGRHALQEDCQLPVKELRQGQHEDQVQDG